MCSATVYVEGDATIGTYQDAEGKVRSALNIKQRTSWQPPPRNSPNANISGAEY